MKSVKSVMTSNSSVSDLSALTENFQLPCRMSDNASLINSIRNLLRGEVNQIAERTTEINNYTKERLKVMRIPCDLLRSNMESTMQESQ